jgi:hypothetical protein
VRFRSVLVLAATTTALAGAWLACSPFTARDDVAVTSEAGPALDAATNANADGASADATADGARPPTDAGADALEGGCYLLVHDDFQTPNPNWMVLGNASFSNGTAVLTAATMGQAGAIYFPVPPAPFRSFEATFTMLVTNGPGSAMTADGVSLAWISDGTPTLGGNGGDMAFCPSNMQQDAPHGAILEMHVYGDGISLRESDGGSCTPELPAPGVFDSSQLVTATVTTNAIDASVGVTPFNAPVLAPVATRWIGIAGATGGFYATFAVDDVTIRVCP